ncbi:MAG: hypothetical protein N4A53_08455 [Pelagimonas sp.]|jgi:hypothetical protein|nr:hypothetical protein [Pelagimonas sp.]
MEPLIRLSDGRVVVIDRGTPPGSSDFNVNLIRIFAADGSELTSDAVDFGNGTPVGGSSSDVSSFAVQPLSGGAIRVITAPYYDGVDGNPYVYTFDIANDGTIQGQAVYYTGDYPRNETPYELAVLNGGAFLVLPDGSIAVATGQSIIWLDSDGVFQTATSRPGPFESVSENTLLLVGDKLLRVTHVNVTGSSEDELRGQFYNLDGTTSGDEFLVADGLNSVTGHWDTELALLEDGRIAVAFVGARDGDEDASEGAIYLTILNADGTGDVAEQLGNTGDTAGGQDWIGLWPLNGGGVAVTYGSETGFTPNDSINVRFFDQDGVQFDSFQRLGTNGRDNGNLLTVSESGVVRWLRINEGSEEQYDATLPNEPGLFGTESVLNRASLGEFSETAETALLADGRVALVYDNTNLVGVVRILDPDSGTTVDVDLLDRTSTGGVREMSVASLADGGFAVAWLEGDNPLTQEIRIQVYNADGSKRGAEQVGFDGESEHIQLHSTQSGFFLAYVNDDGAADDDGNIRFYDANGTALGGPTEYHDGLKQEMDLDATLLPDGRIVMTWMSMNSSTFARTAHFQILNADGSAAGTVQEIGAANAFRAVRVATTEDGGFIIVHADASNALFMSVFHPDGTADVLNDPLPVTAVAGDIRQNFDVAVNGDNQVVVAYAVSAGGADEENVLFSMFTLSGEALILDQIASDNVEDDQNEVELLRLDNGDVFLTFSDDTDDRFASQQSIRGVHIQGGEIAGITLDGDNGDNDLQGGAGADTINGSRGDDTLTGNNGDDSLSGGVGDDSVEGGSGNDVVKGGIGRDTL